MKVYPNVDIYTVPKLEITAKQFKKLPKRAKHNNLLKTK